MRTSGWMKRRPWFWPVKRFIKRISGKELWLKTDVECEVLETGGWIYIPDIRDFRDGSRAWLRYEIRRIKKGARKGRPKSETNYLYWNMPMIFSMMPNRISSAGSSTALSESFST